MYGVISRALPSGKDYVADSIDEQGLAHGPDDIAEIKSIMYDHTKAARVKEEGNLLSLSEFREGFSKSLLSKRGMKQLIEDGYWNPASGTGSMDDPGSYGRAYIPVSMSPQEATAYYASGGVPQVITDKKAKGVLLNGYTFEGDGWTPDEIEKLHEYAEQIGFGEAIANSLRDGLIYGGAIAYPRLKQDNVTSLQQTVDDLIKAKVLTKDSIDHFVTTDRWNCVLVPNWNVTARDYLTPSHYYIPIGGVKVASQRSAIVRPKLLPYWGMLPQIGWGVSDFEGYITSVIAYQITIGAIPVMAQQISLLFHEIELDGAMVQNGISEVQNLLNFNDTQMAAWSQLHPISVNSIGKVSTVERHYQGFEELVKLLMVDIGARGEIPMSVIFPDQPKGLADSNEADVLLKQAESIQKIAITVRPQYRNLSKVVAISCFGPEYFSGANMRKLQTINVSFNPPSVQSAKEKAESGGKFADFVQKIVASDIPVDAALELSKQFFPDVEISKELMARISAIPESQTAPDYARVLAQGGLVEKLIGAAPSTNLQKVLTQGDLAGELAEALIGEE